MTLNSEDEPTFDFEEALFQLEHHPSKLRFAFKNLFATCSFCNSTFRRDRVPIQEGVMICSHCCLETYMGHAKADFQFEILSEYCKDLAELARKIDEVFGSKTMEIPRLAQGTFQELEQMRDYVRDRVPPDGYCYEDFTYLSVL
jgi:hypothetical protein